jgi:AcrR family transcriptional regulator
MTTGPVRNARSERARNAVLDAATSLMLEHGPNAVTVDQIAALSGVSKTTIYKHWPNKIAVTIDAFAAHMAEEVPRPDTGSTRKDLTEQVRAVCAFYASAAGRIFAQLVGEVQTDPDGAGMFLDRFLAGRRQAVRELWERGVRRGDIRPGVDVEIGIDVLFGPAIFRLMTGHAPLDPTAARAIADAALDGLLVDRQVRAAE